MLVPRTWISSWFGKDEHFEGVPFKDRQFEVCPVATTDQRRWWRYLIDFRQLRQHLIEFQPDVIFCIHEEFIWALHQTIFFRKLFARNSRLLFFSMNGVRRPLEKPYYWLLWNIVRRGTDAAIVHDPTLSDQMQRDGYSKPIFIQTQVGVDPQVFRPDDVARATVRNNLGLTGFVIGYAGRLGQIKGVLDLVDAVSELDDDWHLLLVGDGACRNEIENRAEAGGWKQRMTLIGRVPMNEVAQYMRAMDCFVIGSRTTEIWVDTFPLVVAQAMACGTVVVGSDSGAIPYQIGEARLIFPEGNVAELQQRLHLLQNDVELRLQLAEAGRERSLANFCHPKMNEKFVQFIRKYSV